MYYFLFILYLAIACYFIPRIPFIKKTGLGTKTILSLFIFKVAAGLLTGYLSQLYFPGKNDYWALNALFSWEFQLLQNDPGLFFRELYVSGYNGAGYNNFFGSYGSFWNDLENNLIAKIFSPLNFLTRGNYYINSIFFNFFGFFGHVALYRIYDHIYKEKKWAAIAGCFLLPTCIYFSSGIGKDNICFTMICLFCFALYFYTLSSFTFKRVCLLCLFFFAVFLMRNHVALLLLPAAVAFYVSVRKKIRPLKVFGITYLLLVIAAYAISFISPALNAGAVISRKQKDFIELGVANTQLDVKHIEPNFTGLFKNLPQAFDHGFLRPYVWEAGNIMVLLQALELLFYLFLFIAALFFMTRDPIRVSIHPFVLFGVVVAATVLLLNGYIVPNTNTLTRYRSIYLPFLITPLLCMVQTVYQNRLKHIIL